MNLNSVCVIQISEYQINKQEHNKWLKITHKNTYWKQISSLMQKTQNTVNQNQPSKSCSNEKRTTMIKCLIASFDVIKEWFAVMVKIVEL